MQEEILKVFGNQLRMRVCGICLEQDKVLLIRHKYLAKKDYFWSLPGGGMLFGESAEEALKREFLEETGLEIAIKQFLFVHEFLDNPLHAIELFFEVAIIGGNLLKGVDPELSLQNQMIEKVSFLSLDDLNNENPLHLHQIFRDIDSLNAVLKLQGYFISKN